MQRNNVYLLSRNLQKLAISIRYISVRRTMKSITANLVATVKLIRQCVQESFLRQTVMERGVENSDLWESSAEYIARGCYAFDICGIVKRSKVNAFFDTAKDVVRYHNRLAKFFTAVHDSMTYRMDIGNRLYIVNA